MEIQWRSNGDPMEIQWRSIAEERRRHKSGKEKPPTAVTNEGGIDAPWGGDPMEIHGLPTR